MPKDQNKARTRYLNAGPKKKSVQAFWQAYKMEIRQNRKTFIVYSVLRAIVVLCLVREGIRGNYESMFMAILTLVLLTLPTIAQIQLRVDIPPLLEIIIFLFIYAAEILGEINEYYTKIPFWDTILHTLNGFLCAAIGFSLVMILNKKEDVIFDLSPLYIAIVAFSFSMTIGVCWEFIEFSADRLFGLDMQKDTVVHVISSALLNPDGQKPMKIYDIQSTLVNGQELGIDGYLDIGLIDTMKDLFVNFIGAIVFSVIGFFSLTGSAKSQDVSGRFLLRKKEEDTDFLAQAKDQQQVQIALGKMDEEYGVDENEEGRVKRLEEWEKRLTAWQEVLEATSPSGTIGYPELAAQGAVDLFDLSDDEEFAPIGDEEIPIPGGGDEEMPIPGDEEEGDEEEDAGEIIVPDEGGTASDED